MSRKANKLPPVLQIAEVYRINNAQNGLIRITDGVDITGNVSVRIGKKLYSQAHVIYALYHGEQASGLRYKDGDRCNMHVNNLIDTATQSGYDALLHDLLT